MTAAQAASHSTASLYVGDLHNDVTETQLFEVFKEIGPVVSIRVCRDAVTRRSLGYAYVNFHNIADAERALDLLNFKEFKGKPCRIMWSQRDPSLRKSGAGNIFIKNLDTTIDNKTLYDTFSVFGNILSCKVATDESASSKGYGFVHFEKEEEADLAIKMVNEKLLNGKKCYVAKFIPNKTRIRESEPKWTNIYVKNLAKSVNEEQLRVLFTAFGDVTSLYLATDEGKSSKGFGFINYKVHEDARRAVEDMNGKEIDGEQIYVGRAQKKAEREKELKSMFEKIKRERMSKYQGVNLYVKNLDDTIEDVRLREEFAHCGTITSAKIMRDENTGQSKGFGFVCFSTPDEATKAVTEMNGKMIVNKPIYVALAQRKEQRRAQLEAQHAQRANTIRMTHATMPGAPMYPSGAPVYFAGPPGQRGSPFVYPQMVPRGARGFPPQGRPGFQPVPGFVVPPGGAPGPQGGRVPRNPKGGQPGGGQAYPGIKYNPGVRNPQAPPPASDLSAPGAAFAAPAATEPLDAQTIGENLFPLISNALKPLQQEGLAGKITGMFLDSMEAPELVQLLDSQVALNKKIAEALEVLEAAASEPTSA